MNRSTIANSALAITVALPTLLNPAVSVADTQTQHFAQRLQVERGEMAATPSNAKRELQAELRRLTPAQKRQIGEARINQINQIAGNEIVQAGCFTSGVGCKGTSGFTNGVLCCLIKMTGL